MTGDADSASLFERRLERERGARKQAEQLLEHKSRELYAVNQELIQLTRNLERLVDERTAELKDARDEAMAASRAKSAFLANMSHEIRTPMSSVIGMAELLLQSPLSSEQRRHVQVVLDSAKSLLTIINDILDLSKLESGKFRLEVEEFDLLQLLDTVVDILAIPAGGKHLELGVIPAAGLPARVSGDPVRLRQVLLNVVGNAVKFTERGEVRLEVEAVDYGPDRVRLRFEVIDTGPGIAAEDQGCLFEQFSHIESGSAPRPRGTGLGLAISKNLVECMGGEFGVWSEPGRGSRFWFTVSLGKGAVGQPMEPSLPCGLRAVVLTRSPCLGESVLAHLRSLGVETTVVGEPELLLEGLDRVRAGQEPFHLILVDTAELSAMTKGSQVLQTLDGYDGGLSTVTVGWLDSPGSGEPGPGFVRVNRPLTRRKLLDILRPVATLAENGLPVQSEERQASVKRVLLVEDVFPLQLVARAKLERLGYTVDLAGDGHEAVEAVRFRNYGLVLMDIQMPRVDGVSATREIRGLPDPAKASTPIIALTANAMKGDEEAYLAAGMNGYLSKPIDTRQLEAVMERWFAEPAAQEG